MLSNAVKKGALSPRAVVAASGSGRSSCNRGRSSRCLSSFYSPTLTEKRVGEGGPGGRNSEASMKVCLFGASGFLGEHVCSELGTLLYFVPFCQQVVPRLCPRADFLNCFIRSDFVLTVKERTGS
jgi:hypothetical protein